MKAYPLTFEQVEFTAWWWMRRLDKSVPDEKRIAFLNALRIVLRSEEYHWSLFQDREASLVTDYNAWLPLGDALRIAGFKSDSILLLPWKMRTVLRADGSVITAPYSSGPWKQIYPLALAKEQDKNDKVESEEIRSERIEIMREFQEWMRSDAYREATKNCEIAPLPPA